MRSIVLLLAFIGCSLAYTSGVDTYICEVEMPNFCAGGVDPCPQPPMIPLDGTDYDITQNFNVIDFGDFHGTTSDVEGRLLVGGNMNVGNGYSVGYKVWNNGPSSTDATLPYSVVVEGDLTWGSGEILPISTPVGSDYYANTIRENLFVGGNILTGTASNIASRKTNSASGSSLSASMVSAQTFYQQLSDAFAAVTPNAHGSVLYGTLTVTCNSQTDLSYSLNLDGASFNTVTDYAFANCNNAAQMVFNIGGTGNVIFHGTEISPSVRRTERTLYNIVGQGRNVYVATSNGQNQIGGSVMGSILAPNCVFTATGGYTQGITIVGSIAGSWQFNRLTCAIPVKPTTPSTMLCPAFETDCSGLLASIGGNSINFRDMNVISFNNFVANTGDIEGRLACRKNVSLGQGFTIGAELQTVNNLPDEHQAYSLIAGEDVTWVSGELFPIGSGIPYPGEAECMFVGEVFSGANYIAPRQCGSCNGVTGCLDAAFDAALQCYSGYNSVSAAKSDNVDQTVAWDALVLTCQDSTATEYVVTLTPDTMSQYTYTVLNNCNVASYWIINIGGTGDVTLTGDSFPALPGSVLYNVAGQRTVNVFDTSVNGHLLAHESTLYQTGGVILGKVVAADITSSLQINKQNTCPDLTDVKLALVVVVGTNGPTTTLRLLSVNMLRVGDNVTIGSETFTIYSIDYQNNEIELSHATSGSVNAGKAGFASIKAYGSRGMVANPQDSSASVATIAVAIFALLALIL